MPEGRRHVSISLRKASVQLVRVHTHKYFTLRDWIAICLVRWKHLNNAIKLFPSNTPTPPHPTPLN